MKGTERTPLARAADGLTLLRLGTAPVLALLVWTGQWVAVAVLLAVGWLTDFADGRLARRAGGGTRLGRWDMTADTAVGSGLLVGLILQGAVPDVIGLPALVVLGFLHVRGNIAASMLLQLAGFVPTLLILWEDRPSLWWAPFAVIALIGVVDWRRLVIIHIPAFLRGLIGRFEGPWRRSRT